MWRSDPKDKQRSTQSQQWRGERAFGEHSEEFVPYGDLPGDGEAMEKRSNCMKAYPYIRCLFCRSGEEQKLAQLIEYMNYGKPLIPRKVKRIFRQGKWIEEERKLLPGYVFVFNDQAIPFRSILSLPPVIRVLRYADDLEGYLEGQDRALAELFLEKEGRIGVLEALKEGDFIRITDGLLSQYGGKVLRMDRRKQMAEIELNVAGDINRVWLSFEVIEQIETRKETGHEIQA